MGRRRAGSLIPIEVGILSVCLEAGESGEHGFAIARDLQSRGDTRNLTATGTLYRALERLEAAGLLASWWEEPETAAEAGRPRRRFYRITGGGANALAAATVAGRDRIGTRSESAAHSRLRPRTTP